MSVLHNHQIYHHIDAEAELTKMLREAVDKEIAKEAVKRGIEGSIASLKTQAQLSIIYIEIIMEKIFKNHCT